MNDNSETLVDVAHLLIFVQGAIAVTMVLEAAVGGLLAGPAAALVVIPTVVTAVLILSSARGVARRSKRARRIVILVEVFIVLMATIDLLLAVLLARRSLELVPILTRFVLPITVIRLLRRPASRVEFGMKPRRAVVVGRG